jgi:hypothetical protein
VDCAATRLLIPKLRRKSTNTVPQYFLSPRNRICIWYPQFRLTEESLKPPTRPQITAHGIRATIISFSSRASHSRFFMPVTMPLAAISESVRKCLLGLIYPLQLGCQSKSFDIFRNVIYFLLNEIIHGRDPRVRGSRLDFRDPLGIICPCFS